MNLRSLYEQDGYWNKAKFLLASRADKPSFAQTRCAQTVRSVTAASAKLVTKLDQGSRIRPVHRDCCIHEMFHMKQSYLL